MLGYVEHLDGFVEGPVLGVLVDDEINVDVSVDKVAIGRPSHGPLNSEYLIQSSTLICYRPMFRIRTYHFDMDPYQGTTDPILGV